MLFRLTRVDCTPHCLSLVFVMSLIKEGSCMYSLISNGCQHYMNHYRSLISDSNGLFPAHFILYLLKFWCLFFFSAPSYPQASVLHAQPSQGVVTFPEEQTQPSVVHPTHIMEPQQYDERPYLRNIPLTQRLSQEDISER